MSVHVPPSPKASQAPEHAERIREVREIARGKRPTKRLRKSKGRDAVKAARTAKAAKTAKTVKADNATKSPTPRKVSGNATGNVPGNAAGKRPLQVISTRRAPKQDSKERTRQEPSSARGVDGQHVRKPRLVQKPAAAGSHSQAKDEQVTQTTTVLSAIAASVVVSLAVNFALQGMPVKLISGIATVAGGTLAGIGWGV